MATNEIQRADLTDCPANQEYGFRAVGTTQAFAWKPLDGAAALESGIEALDAYDGKAVDIVDGTDTAADPDTDEDLYSGPLRMTFTPAGDVPALEAKNSECQRATVVGGDSGNYKINDSANFTLADSLSSIQTKLRASDGNSDGKWTGVVLAGVITPPTSGTNRAQGATILDDDGTLNKANMFDGNTGTIGQFLASGFILLDLLAAYDLASCAILADADVNQVPIVIKKSNALGADLGTLGTFTTLTANSTNTQSLSSATGVRYVKIVCNGPGTGAATMIKELRLLEVASPGSAVIDIHFPYSAGNPAAGAVTGTGITIATRVQGGS